MSDLARTTSVDCPVNQAKMHLDAFFAEHGGTSDGENTKASLALRAPMGLPGVTLERGVEVRLLRHKRPVDAFDQIDVDWEVPGSALYPRFHGMLSVEANDDYNTFMLALRGSYDPPGGLVGQAFDAALGHRIAEATADDLLAQMRDSIESSYHGVESAKRHDPAHPGLQ